MKHSFSVKKLAGYCLIGLMAFSCQVEEEVLLRSNPATGSDHLKIRTLTKEEFKNQAPRAFGKINQLKNAAAGGSTANLRTVQLANDFYVDTQEILEISLEGRVSYTLPIHRYEDNGLLENLVLTLEADGTYSAKIVAYHDLTESEKELIRNDALLDLTTRIEVTELDDPETISQMVLRTADKMCYEMFFQYEMCCYNEHTSLAILNGAQCKCSQKPTGYTYVINSVPCPEQYQGGGSAFFGDTGTGSYTAPPSGQDYGGGGTGSSTNIGTSPSTTTTTQETSSPVRDLGTLTKPKISLNPPSSTPCEKLNSLTNNNALKNALQDLATKTNEGIEHGYAIHKEGNGYGNNPETVANDPNNPGVLKMINYIGGSFVGEFHTHPDPFAGYYPMFSGTDLTYMFFVASRHNNNGQPKDYNDYVLTLTTVHGTYALKINNFMKLATAINTIGLDKIDNRLWRKYEVRNPYNDSVENMMADLLKTIKELDLGISLYEADPTLTQWSEIELNNDPILSPTVPVTRKPCN